jgi:hypothetical protein
MNTDVGHWFAEGTVGPQVNADGAQTRFRMEKSGSLIVAHGHAPYQEPVSRGNVFSLTLSATTTGVAAGNIIGAAAAASTNFALFNPTNSGKLLVLTKFRLAVISGTPGGGPVFHGYIGNVPSATPTGNIRSNILSAAPASVALTYATAGGTALTGGLAPVTHMLANFGSTNTAQASVNLVAAEDALDGSLIIPQGAGWLPLWSAAGTSLLCGYSITWEEIPA